MSELFDNEKEKINLAKMLSFLNEIFAGFGVFIKTLETTNDE